MQPPSELMPKILHVLSLASSTGQTENLVGNFKDLEDTESSDGGASIPK